MFVLISTLDIFILVVELQLILVPLEHIVFILLTDVTVLLEGFVVFGFYFLVDDGPALSSR